MNDSQIALKRFELENEIVEENALYHFDEEESNRLYKTKPWK